MQPEWQVVTKRQSVTDRVTEKKTYRDTNRLTERKTDRYREAVKYKLAFRHTGR